MRQRLLEMERKNLIGKLITLIQLLVSVICVSSFHFNIS